MGRIPVIISDMAASNIQPNIITYCSIIKCYCQENRIDRALEVMEQMRMNSELQPDEHTYNTVINGCARQGFYDKGVAILEDMCNAGIKPSNFTLSVLVKLASRSRRLDRAFLLCEELSQKYDLRLNVHVYNNLIQACIAHKGLQSAFKVVERMLRQKVRLDTRTYTLLLQACADAGEAQDVAGLIRAAAGLDGVHPLLADAPRNFLQPHGGLPSQLLSDMVQGIAARGSNITLAKQLVQELRHSANCKMDPKTSIQILKK
jgi:pentatricopeptide repeat protein